MPRSQKRTIETKRLQAVRKLGAHPTVDKVYLACFHPDGILKPSSVKEAELDPYMDVMVNQRRVPSRVSALARSRVGGVITERRVRLGMQTCQDIDAPDEVLSGRYPVINRGFMRSFEALARAELDRGRHFGDPVLAGRLLGNATRRQVFKIEQQLWQRAAFFSRFVRTSYSVQYPFAINVGDLENPELLPFIRDLFEQYGIPPGGIIVELLEGLQILTPGDVVKIQELIKLGCKIAIDDYGDSVLSPSGEVLKPNNSKQNLDILAHADVQVDQVKFPGEVTVDLDSDSLSVILDDVRKIAALGVRHLIWEGSPAVSIDNVKMVRIIHDVMRTEAVDSSGGNAVPRHYFAGTAHSYPFHDGEGDTATWTTFPGGAPSREVPPVDADW